MVREAVYADIGPRRRSEQHARAAAILAARGAPDERVAAQIVEPIRPATPSGWRCCAGWARGALARGAPVAARAWLRRALAEPPPAAERAEVLLALGSAELRLGAPEAVAHLSEAFDSAADPSLLAAAARQLALALSVTGDSDEAVAMLERAIEAVEPVDRELALLLEAEVASHAQQAGSRTRRRRRAAPGAPRRAGGRDPGRAAGAGRPGVRAGQDSESADAAAAHLEAALAGGRLLEEQHRDRSAPSTTS